MDINSDRRRMATTRIQEMLGDMNGKTVGLLGLSFKPNTDDMRDAPSIDIARALIAAGARVRATDPVAMEVATGLMPNVEMCDDVYEMARECDALMVITEWNEYKQLDLARLREQMRQPVIFDGRNIYDPAVMKRLGFDYQAMGRGFNGATVFPSNGAAA
jgi:UDPglucose 6-dehydrogenase